MSRRDITPVPDAWPVCVHVSHGDPLPFVLRRVYVLQNPSGKIEMEWVWQRDCPRSHHKISPRAANAEGLLPGDVTS